LVEDKASFLSQLWKSGGNSFVVEPHGTVFCVVALTYLGENDGNAEPDYSRGKGSLSIGQRPPTAVLRSAHLNEAFLHA
jgi:hypothetical protein